MGGHTERIVILFNKRPVTYCTSYKYLGCNINEYLEYNYTAGILAESLGLALSCIVTKMIN